MNKVAEAVVRFVSSAGVGAVVSNAIASTTPSNAAANVLSRVLVGIGEAVLSSSLSSFAVGTAAVRHSSTGVGDTSHPRTLPTARLRCHTGGRAWSPIGRIRRRGPRLRLET